MTSRLPWARLLLPVGLAALFALLAWAVLARHGTPYALDTGPHRWSVAHRPHAMATAARAVTGLGTGAAPYLAAVLGGYLAGGGRAKTRGDAAVGAEVREAARGIPTALLALVVLLAGQAVRTLLMAVLHRGRPPAADWATHVSGHAFPSGHTASSAIAAGLLAWGLLRWRPGRTGRALAAVCGLVAAAVGCSRVYLGVHWPTDVLGGWLFAACWLAATLPPLASFVTAARTGPDQTDPEQPGPDQPDPDQTDTP